MLIDQRQKRNWPKKPELDTFRRHRSARGLLIIYNAAALRGVINAALCVSTQNHNSGGPETQSRNSGGPIRELFSILHGPNASHRAGVGYEDDNLPPLIAA